MPYLIALGLSCVFVANIVIGAVGQAPIVGVVTEMLILFGAAISFCVGILRSEAREISKKE